jgi:hypothetical protein
MTLKVRVLKNFTCTFDEISHDNSNKRDIYYGNVFQLNDNIRSAIYGLIFCSTLKYSRRHETKFHMRN